MTLMTRKRRTNVRRMIDLARRRGDGGVALLPGAAQSGMHWLARDCGLGVSLTPTAGTLGPDSVTRGSALWLMDYVESTASTPASVDGPVGFLSDGEGTVSGVNIVANPGPFTTTVSWASNGGAAIAATGGELVVTNTANGGSEQAQQDVFASVQPNTTYQITVSGRRGTASNFQFGVETSGQSLFFSAGYTNTSAQSYTGYFTMPAGQTICMVKLRANGVGTAMFGSVSIRAITGRHATQNSGPSKPTMRRGLVNMFQQSATLGATAWGTNGGGVATSNSAVGLDGATLNASTLTCTSTGGSGVYLPSSNTGLTAAGIPATLFAFVRRVSGASTIAMLGGDTTNFWLRFNPQTMAIMSTGSAITSSAVVALQNGYYLFVWSGVTTAASSMVVYNIDVSNGVTLAIANTGGVTGIVTAAQLLASGMAATTTVPASSSGGNYGLDWNGSSAALALSSVPFQLSDEHYVIAGATPYSAAGYQDVFSVNGATTNPKAAQIEFGGGALSAYWQDDAGAVQVINTGYVVGVPIVITAFRKGGVGAMRVNGVQVGTSSTALGAATLTTATIGARGFGPSNFFGGRIGPVVIIKGPLTAAELLVIERGVAALTGPLGVKF